MKPRNGGRPVVLPRAFTKPETAAYMGISVASVEKLVGSGRLRPIRYPGIRRDYFDRATVDLLMDQSEASAVPASVPAIGSKWGFLRVARGGK